MAKYKQSIHPGDMVTFKSTAPDVRGYNLPGMHVLIGHTYRVTYAHESTSYPGTTIFRIEYKGLCRGASDWWFHEDQVEIACDIEDTPIDKGAALEAWEALMS